ncbi:MAG: tRNA uridine-5-carboxymethylaminomethyl(34) synthesis GTPase MnmE [Caulobacteraceae bacterium]|nr:tRNA uridine-5-carboxymethylaminomethyl(34) synthesis GTPase MnmE [Caulobacter sp.]
MIDTVYALATPPGRSAVAVVRLSGSRSGEALTALTGRSPPTPRRASLRRLRDGAGAVLDEALVLWTPAPASYTGEDAAELHLHGGPAVITAVLEALSAAGLRAAAPGEFTRRAFANGRMDLAEAEGVADLVDAETEAQRRQAVAQLGGALSARYAEWREWLLQAAAQLAAAVDFPDEEVPTDVAARAAPPLVRLRDDLSAALDDRRGERVRDGFRVALIGAPNAGKSSLLNALAGRDAAIVTPIPGTTRDVVEVVLDIAGRRVVMADTAGLRESADPVEAEGVRRARAWAQGADLRLWVTAPDESQSLEALGPGDVRVLSKADLVERPASEQAVAASVLAPGGLDALLSALRAHVIAGTGGDAPAVVTRARHRESIAAALTEIDRALEAAPRAPELAAESVRLAARALGRLTGEVEPEAVLDQVFSAFCIGK